jgi:hypothetical protein
MFWGVEGGEEYLFWESFGFFVRVHKFENNCFINGTNLPNFRNHKTDKKKKKETSGWLEAIL